MLRAITRRLCAGPILGGPAFLIAFVALSVPTMVRLAVGQTVAGCEFTPYLPFIFVCAITLSCWAASSVAAGAVAIMGNALGGALPHGTACFLDSATIFLGCSALMIGIATLVRRVIVGLQRRGADESAGGVVFSLENGQVWASWYGQSAPTLIGSQRKVSEMMQDFLKQQEVADRLLGNCSPPAAWKPNAR